MTTGLKIKIVSADGGDSECYGIGYLVENETDDYSDRPIAWVCTGHSQQQQCTSARYISAREGGHFIDALGPCRQLVGGVWESDHECPTDEDGESRGDTVHFPGKDAPVANFTQGYGFV